MSIFDKIREPVILKEDSSATKELEILNQLADKADGTLKTEIQKQIKFVKYGIDGENTIMFELKNSHMPIIVIHDLFLSMNELKVQIDYMVITRKITFIIESKNLYGNITVDEQGNFIRTVSFGNNFKKEGLYSPVTQKEYPFLLELPNS